ncbi:hypothetical protein SLS58_003255 [Diplodia intermedia]|uniref:Glyoxalase/fosfomycin resistance/dioxygenase domain-containing protein n=1 Tax=Diplodia intermedia TaxID=856260 RepID=A0ABR3TWG5_9PEZI
MAQNRVLGFKLLGEVVHIKRSEKPNDGIFKIYPENLQEVKLAKMVTGNGVGFEIFEFVDPKFKEAKVFDYSQRGFFHVCITDPDPEALAVKFEAEGGKRVGRTIDPSGKSEITCLYLSDPWGNIVEVLDVGFEFMGLRSAL